MVEITLVTTCEPRWAGSISGGEQMSGREARLRLSSRLLGIGRCEC
jgi:hypothetical protein